MTKFYLPTSVILSLEEGGKTRYYILEVKRSMRRTYLVDGAYKLLGYLKDFEKIQDENTALKGFLIGWKGIQTIQYNSDKEVQLFTWESFDNGLVDLLKLRKT